jgi:hypothetical protein
VSRAGRLMDKAREQAGLANFGELSFIEGLERLTASLDTEGNLNDIGRMATDAQSVALLVNRLHIEDWYARHPEIEDEQIIAPLVGIGLPRTGSTALACMLGEDPAYRSLRTWESVRPCPPPGVTDMASDTRIAESEASMVRRAHMFPRMTAMLPSEPTSPTECQLFMGYEFKSQFFQAYANIPSYVMWFTYEADMVPAYRYVKRVLKLLQWRCPMRGWRLKNPTHSLFINAFNMVFPDARFVMTHRDVAAVVPSVADLYLELRQAFSNDVDLHAIGRETTEFCELAMRRMIAFRDAGNEQRVFDIHFASFQRNPTPSIEALYAFLGAELTPQAQAGMDSWRRSKPRELQTYTRTDPAAFGLDMRELRLRFQFYAARFGIDAIAS